ncbi:MAG: hypothetical protein HYW45_03485 [Candidatus Daviesbacteria bacterium]|nr:MAG: hypothetical protein HYW45_03485 [Candidatus Daviesbacteria bacterium]
MTIQERQSVGDSFHLMEDRGFQDWLKSTGIILEARNQSPLNFTNSLTSREGHFAEILEINRGYLIPPYVPFRNDGVDPKYAAFLSYVYASRLRGKIVEPGVIYTAPGFGYGVGIENMRLSRGPGRLLYRLWIQGGKLVTLSVLGEDLFNGQTGVYENNLLRVLVYRLRQELRGTKIWVKSGEGSYGVFLNEAN